jgi:uncharacterized surface protein with fasciclin (FAS1) repeats
MKCFETFFNLCVVISGLGLLIKVAAARSIQDPYNYRNINTSYVAPVPENVTTLLDLIHSRSDLSSLAAALEQCGGFEQAFDTNPTWKFTFFAPNNAAFSEIGKYFSTMENTPLVLFAFFGSKPYV